jgi:hypothetical protein
MLIVGEGENQTTFSVHQNLLSASSQFFEAACKPEWMKPEDGKIRLPEDSPTAVQVFVYWLYHNEICIPKEYWENEGETTQSALKTAGGLLAKVYVFGEKNQIPRLCNAAIDAILYVLREIRISLGIVPYIYQNTPSDSSFRRLIVTIATYHSDPDDASRWQSVLSSEFLFAVTLIAFRREEVDDPETD